MYMFWPSNRIIHSLVQAHALIHTHLLLVWLYESAQSRDPQNYNMSNVVTASQECGFAISGDTAILGVGGCDNCELHIHIT